MKPQRGEVWYVELDPTRGHEQAKKRPSLIISSDVFNKGSSGLVIVIPFTSKNRKNPLHVSIVPPEGGLSMQSYILSEHIRSVAIERLKGDKPIGVISTDTIDLVIEKLYALLDL